MDKAELEEGSGERLNFYVNDEVEPAKTQKCYETLLSLITDIYATLVVSF